MNQRIGAVSVVLLAVLAGACRDPLVAENLNNPDVERVFAQPASIEQALGSGYQVCRNTAMGTDGYQQMASMAWENGSSLNNFSMGPRSALPRPPILNNKSAQQALSGTYNAWSRQARSAGNTIQQLDKLTSGGGTGLGSAALNLRARAFGFFVMACNLGHLAMMYDSAGITSHVMPGDSVPPLSGYPEVAARALAYLDSAIALANNPASTAFPTPSAWMQAKSLSKTEFVQLMRSWKARIRANIARTPQERAAVNWNEVIADANAGITTTLEVGVGGTTGWSQAWNSLSFHQDQTWHQMPMFYFGMADVSGGFDAWLATPIDARTYFLLVTPDLRWPQGADRATQRTNSTVPGGYASRPYIENRKTADSPSEPWVNSYYEYERYVYIRLAGGTGTYPEFMPAELTTLAAEGYIRTGQFELAAQKIDATRVARGGLPALAGTGMTGTSKVGTLPNCVPRVPQPPNFTSTDCGTLMEAMKYEARIELAFNQLGSWFYPMRGWGDLATGTPLQYPVPVVELDTRFLPYYNLGGGGPSSAVRGTYGYP